MNIIVTDIGKSTMELLNLNIKRNGLNLKTIEFDWNDHSDSRHEIFKCIKNKQASLVIAADVLYNTSSHDILLSTMKSFKRLNENIQFLIAYKFRTIGEEIFFTKSLNIGFKCKTIYHKFDVIIYHFQ